MENGEDFRLVFVTAGSEENARKIACSLIHERLAACCSMIGGVTSIYHWQDGIEESREIMLMIKTSASLLESLEHRIRQLHDYDTPEIIGMTMDSVSAPYLAWLKNSLVLNT